MDKIKENSDLLVIPFTVGSMIVMVSSFVILVNSTGLNLLSCIAIAAGITIIVDVGLLYAMYKVAKSR